METSLNDGLARLQQRTFHSTNEWSLQKMQVFLMMKNDEENNVSKILAIVVDLFGCCAHSIWAYRIFMFILFIIIIIVVVCLHLLRIELIIIEIARTVWVFVLSTNHWNADQFVRLYFRFRFHSVYVHTYVCSFVWWKEAIKPLTNAKQTSFVDDTWLSEHYYTPSEKQVNKLLLLLLFGFLVRFPTIKIKSVYRPRKRMHAICHVWYSFGGSG